jgi:hypothetical protein
MKEPRPTREPIAMLSLECHQTSPHLEEFQDGTHAPAGQCQKELPPQIGAAWFNLFNVIGAQIS